MDCIIVWPSLDVYYQYLKESQQKSNNIILPIKEFLLLKNKIHRLTCLCRTTLNSDDFKNASLYTLQNTCHHKITHLAYMAKREWSQWMGDLLLCNFWRYLLLHNNIFSCMHLTAYFNMIFVIYVYKTVEQINNRRYWLTKKYLIYIKKIFKVPIKIHNLPTKIFNSHKKNPFTG